MGRFSGKVAVITGAGSGIVQATALSIRLRRRNGRVPRHRRGRGGEHRGRDRRSRWERVGVPLQRRRPGERHRRGRRGRVGYRRAERVVQHRRRRRLRQHDRVSLRRMAARDRGEPHRHLPHVPGDTPAHPRERRQHRQHRFERRAPRTRLCRGVLRVEGRCRPAHPRAGDRILEARYPGERGRARRRRHTAVAAASRCRTTPTCRSWRR